MEQWLPIAEYPNYLISSEGRLARSGFSRRPVPVHECRGYLRVTLTSNSKSRAIAVHRLVLEAFIGPCPEGYIGLHNNDDRRDNRVTNLRWGTYKENSADAKRNGRVKVADEIVRSLRSSTKTDLELAQEMNMSETAVFNARYAISYRHVR